MILEVHVFAYNHEDFIERTLKSVLAQETEFAFGLRIHDDASSDATVEIIERTLAASDIPWELVRATENRFSSGVDFWHDFLATSTAPFVAVLDGDDLWLDPSKLQRQMDLLLANPSAAICHHRVVELLGESMHETEWPPPQFREESVPGSQLSEFNPISTSSVVLRRAFLPTRMPAGFNELRVADYAVWALTSQGREIAYIDRPMGAYRIHEGSMYSSQSKRHRILEEMKTRQFIGLHVAEVDRPAWRTGLLNAIDYWLGENARLADDLHRIADELADVLARNANLQHDLADVIAVVDELQSSTSWRVTAPLRRLRTAINHRP
ncbi:glycosyltransferase [Microbacterium sp. Root166]|uniref:glycosyltransferase n=1 Tax=Microbacterium sp. Root166 TaxID=1736478 RepID=UPI00138EE5B8|nr:glycosyltransferase [Microbacterium sp. Root166]